MAVAITILRVTARRAAALQATVVGTVHRATEAVATVAVTAAAVAVAGDIHREAEVVVATPVVVDTRLAVDIRRAAITKLGTKALVAIPLSKL